MSKLVLSTNDTVLQEKVESFAKLLGLSLEVQSEGAEVLPFPTVQSVMPTQTLEQVESEVIQKAISAHKGNLTEVAKALNIGRATLYRKVKQYQIDTKAVRTKKVA